MKVVKIAMVQVLDLIKDERTFNNLSFMKSKFHNWLSTHFNFVFTCHPNFYMVTHFPYNEVMTLRKEVYIRY
jgi:hypothetical protein